MWGTERKAGWRVGCYGQMMSSVAVSPYKLVIKVVSQAVGGHSLSEAFSHIRM